MRIFFFFGGVLYLSFMVILPGGPSRDCLAVTGRHPVSPSPNHINRSLHGFTRGPRVSSGRHVKIPGAG